MSSRRDNDRAGPELVGKSQFLKEVQQSFPLLTPAEEKLVDAAAAIQQLPAADADELAFFPRGLLQCTLPHSNPGATPVWGLRSGTFYLVIEPGHKLDDEGQPKSYGYPYGSIPRLVISYLNLQVKRHESRRVSLGDTLSAFMAELDMVPTGGRWGSITRLRKQVLALFNARIAYGNDPDGGEKRANVTITDQYDLWWDPKSPAQQSIFPNYVELGEKLFSDMLEHGIPLDMRALKALRRSPLALDLYAWATYRVSTLREPAAISWSALYRQFGSNYSELRNFQQAASAQLRKVKALYPALNFRTVKGRLILLPSATHVPMKVSRRRIARASH